jgi:hypothetical protein
MDRGDVSFILGVGLSQEGGNALNKRWEMLGETRNGWVVHLWKVLHVPTGYGEGPSNNLRCLDGQSSQETLLKLAVGAPKYQINGCLWS